jgi:hypothetical protein
MSVIRSTIIPSKDNDRQYDIEFVFDAQESVTVRVCGDKESDLNEMIDKARALLEKIMPGEFASTDVAGYKILSLPEIGGFAACDDEGQPLSPTFSTQKEAVVWAGKHPRNKMPVKKKDGIEIRWP